MHAASLRAFRVELIKLAAEKRPNPQAAMPSQNIPLPIPPPPTGPMEGMTGASWKQTAKDLPVAILAGGAGWAVGRTVGDLLGEHFAKSPEIKADIKNNYAPLAASVLASIGSYAWGRQREILRQRRAQANREADAKKALPKTAEAQVLNARIKAPAMSVFKARAPSDEAEVT